MQEMCALLSICHLHGHWKDKRSLFQAGLLHKSGSHSFPVQQSGEVYQPWVYIKNKSPQNTFSCSVLIFSKIKLSQRKERSWRNKQQGEALTRNELVIAFWALQLDRGHWGHSTGDLSPPQVRANTKLWGCKQLLVIWVQTRGRQGWPSHLLGLILLSSLTQFREHKVFVASRINKRKTDPSWGQCKC